MAVPFARWGRHRKGQEAAAFQFAALGSAFLLGTAFYAAVLTVAGVAGFLVPTVLAVSLVPGLAGFAVVAVKYSGGWDTFVRSLSAFRGQPGFIGVLAILLALMVLGFGFAAWFTPPKGDAAAFYLVYPKIVAAAGTLFPMPGNYMGFSEIGLSAEYHFAALIALADVSAAKLFIFPVALALAVLLAGLVRTCGGGPTAVVLGCAMLFTSSTVHIYMFDGKVDLLATSFGLASVYWLVAAAGYDERGYSSLALSGLFAGLAIVAKFSYIPSLGTTLLVLLIWRVARREDILGVGRFVRTLLAAGGVMGLSALVGWLPQLLKNGVLFNAPLAPFIGSSVTDGFLDQVWFSPEATLQIVLTYPLALIYGRYPMQGGGLSILFLSFLPLLFVARRRIVRPVSGAGILALAGLAGVMAWVILRPSVIAPRYILASLLLPIPFFVIKVEQLLRERKGPAFLGFGVSVSVLAAIGASSWQLLPVASSVMASLRGADRTCLAASPECEPLRQLSSEAAPGDRMLVATYYALWLNASHLQCRDQDGELSTALAEANLIHWLQQRGFRYVLVDKWVYPKLAEKLGALNGGGAEAMSVGNDTITIYRILPGAQPDTACVNIGRDRWILKDTSP